MAALVQESDARSNTTLTLGSGIVSGNALIVAVWVLDTGVTVSSVTIGGDAMTAVPSGTGIVMSHAGPGTDATRLNFYTRPNITGTPTAIAVTLSGTPGDTSYIQAWEVSGLGTTITVDDVQNSGAAQSGTAHTVGFTADGSGFAVGVIGVGNTGTSTPGSGWTQSYSDAGSANFMHRVIASSGSYTADATGPNGTWNAAALLIADAASGPARPVIFAGPRQRSNN